MFNSQTISPEEILKQVKFSGQLPTMREGIAMRHAIAHAAEAAGITVTIAELQQGADGVRLLHQLQSSEATWAWLQQQGLSLDEFEEMVQASLLSAKLAHHLFADKVEPFFVEHQLDYTQIILYEVILEDEDLAMELFYAIEAGEFSFHHIAHEYIQNPNLRRVGGYRGVLRRGDLKPEISAAVFAATPPQLLKPIITAEGIHLILVEELIQPELDEQLKQQILSELFIAWLKQAIAQQATPNRSADDERS